MKEASIFVDNLLAGHLQEIVKGKHYRFTYLEGYQGPPVSLEMPTQKAIYDYDRFPPFFEGLLPEGMMLEALLRQAKIDRHDLMSQIVVIGKDLVGNVTVEASK